MLGDLIEADLPVHRVELIVRDEPAGVEHAELDGSAAEVDCHGAHAVLLVVVGPAGW